MYRYISTDKKSYKLCEASIMLRGGIETKVYYFIGEQQEPKKGSHYANSLPDGFEIVEAPKSGHPLVRKSHNN